MIELLGVEFFTAYEIDSQISLPSAQLRSVLSANQGSRSQSHAVGNDRYVREETAG
jgi:hypothetical protein